MQINTLKYTLVIGYLFVFRKIEAMFSIELIVVEMYLIGGSEYLFQKQMCIKLQDLDLLLRTNSKIQLRRVLQLNQRYV